MSSRWFCLIGFYFCIVLSHLYGQGNPLNEIIQLPKDIQLTTKKDYLDYLSNQYQWVFSYNASDVRMESEAPYPNRQMTLQVLLYHLFPDELQEIIFVSPDKIILKFSKIQVKEYSIAGYVTDLNTGEAIYGAYLVDKTTRRSAISNERGYYVMRLPKGKAKIDTYYLGYKTASTNIEVIQSTLLHFKLESDNYLDTITVYKPSSRLQLADGGHQVNIFKNNDFQSIIGQSDIINNARIIPGVQSGGEGLSGLYVRGGTPDQNLIMLDGVAMYETSHVAGIASIFMDESIKEGSFIRNGFPARYGGRLSSVMDIQLKEGDKFKNNTSISMGLAGATAHIDGPIIKEKLTYSLSGRTSWINLYINNLLRKFTKYDDILLNYHDLLGKLTYHFSESNSLSFTMYNGADRFQLTKENTFENKESNYTLHIFDKNGINWKNNVASLKWNFLVGERLSVKVQSGYIAYQNGTRSSYIFNSSVKDSTNSDILDVITKSIISDKNLRIDADYFFNDNHILRGGINYIHQHYNPTVRQSTVFLQGAEENITDQDSAVYAGQWQFYLEDNFKWADKIFLYGGLHYGTYSNSDKAYHLLQPRFKVIWSPHDRHMLTASYSRMAQPFHLLSNSGLGLPSDLWVPATTRIKPLLSDQWSASYTFNITKNLYLYLGAYTKHMKNTLEYTSPVELFYFLINDQNITPVYNSSKDWERNVYSGTGHSQGLELLIHKTSGRLKGWFSLTRSKTIFQYNEINNGKAFPAAHDKPWDMNTGVNFKFSNRFSAGANFVYNTGKAFSLATEEYASYLGIKLLNAEGKNNYRLPDFHQLTVSASYHYENKDYIADISLNIYNVYNRLNAYYIYIYKNHLAPDEQFLKKVSILPITPSIIGTIRF